MATATDESFICLWLAPDIDSVDNKKTQKKLRQIYNDLRIFNEVARCETEIGNLTDEKIVLIVSGGFGREILPRLSDLPQLSTCYIYCANRAANIGWAKEYPKVTFFLIRHLISFELSRSKKFLMILPYLSIK